MYLLIFAQYLFFSIVSDLEKGVTSKTRALHYAQAVARMCIAIQIAFIIIPKNAYNEK